MAGRPESEASDAGPAGEDQGGDGDPSGDAREAGGRGAAAEDALIPERTETSETPSSDEPTQD
jgi:hypothetical protein